jgi:ribosomal-protein-alanine N-acetyltransferase
MIKSARDRVNIRRMAHSDIHEVLALDRVIRGPGHDVIRYEDIASANLGVSPDLSFVAEVDGRMVGFSINRSMYLMVPLTEVCIIHAMLIHPDYRKLGIGSKLVQALLEQCRAEGITTIRAPIPRADKELRAILERHGFRSSSIVNFDITLDSQA